MASETNQSHAPEATEAAWREYREALEAVRRQVLDHPLAADPKIRAQGLYFLQMQQVTAFAKYLAPRHAYPSLNIHLEFMPFELTTGQSNPDFLYRWSYLDGRRTYRLWGRLGTTRWTDLQIINGFWGDAVMDTVGNHTLEAFEHGPDGAFEIILSATPHPGNWIRLDPASGNNVMLVRETWCDWESERGVEMRIEAVDLTDDEPIVYDEDEFNRRLRAAARYLRFSTNFSINTTQRIQAGAGGRNAFFDVTAPPAQTDDRPKVGGSNPQARFLMMVYEIAPDEALIIESEPRCAKYWGLSQGDVWFASIDYSYHQSSLNDVQAAPDADGRLRFVLAHHDPGVANWLDTVGTGVGVVLYRAYLAEPFPLPITRRIKLSEVRQHLPADTALVTPDERRERLERRKRASLARYGF